MKSCGSSSRKLSTSSKTGRVEREGRKVKEVNVIVLDSDPEETSGSSQSYNMEEANDTKLRNSMAGRLSVDGTPGLTPRTRFPSFLEETSPLKTPEHAGMSKRTASHRAQKRIKHLYKPELPVHIGSSHHQRSGRVVCLTDEKEIPTLDLSASTEKKSKLSVKDESAMYSSVGGCKTSHTVRRKSGSAHELRQVNYIKKRSSCPVSFVQSNANVRSRPVMSSSAGNDDEDFDLYLASKPSDRAKRYEDKPFTPRKSVEAITNSATPRPPLRFHSNDSTASNTESFYSKSSPTTSDSRFLSEATIETPRVKRHGQLGLKQSGNDTTKKRRRTRNEPVEPEYIDLDSGEEHSRQMDTANEPEQTVKPYSEEENQELCCKTRKITEDERMKLLEPLIRADRPSVQLPVALLMVGTVQLQVVEPAVLRRDTISFRYLQQDDYGNQANGYPRWVNIGLKDITAIKSNLFDKEPCKPVLVLQTRGDTRARLQGSFNLKNRGIVYDPKSSVSAKRYIVLVLEEILDDTTLFFLQFSVERATKHTIPWHELSREDVTDLLAGVHCKEKVQQTSPDKQPLSNRKEHKKQSKIQGPTRKSVITKLNQDQDSEDEDELPSLDSLLASEKPEVPLSKEIITAKALEAMKKVEIRKKHEELEGPKESKECDKTVLRYKSSCTYGASGITVTMSDVSLLMPDCWFNDNLINFYLMYLYDSVLTDEQRNQTYIFSTFLHQKLSEMGKKQNRRSGSNSIEEDKKQLRRWTKDVDLLSKDFLVIPINQSNAHWYLVIVCYARLALTVNSQPSSNPISQSSHASRHSTPKTSVKSEAMHIANRTLTDHCDSTPKASGSHLSDTEVDIERTPDESGEPLEYFKSLADSPSDMSCSDRVQLFDVPEFESGQDGENRRESGDDRSTGVDRTETNDEKMEIDDDKKEPPSMSTSPSPTVQGSTDSLEASWIEHSSSGGERDRLSTNRKKANKRSDPLEQKACILFFDSLKASGRKTTPARLIREYLTREYQSQQPDDDFKFDHKNLPAEYPKVPSQPNSCDCGIFVCQFAESFFKAPILDYRSPILLIDWFSSHFVVSHKRQELRDLIEELGTRNTDR